MHPDRDRLSVSSAPRISGTLRDLAASLDYSQKGKSIEENSLELTQCLSHFEKNSQESITKIKIIIFV